MVVSDFRGDSPGWNLPNVKFHRAVLDLIKVHRAVSFVLPRVPKRCGFGAQSGY
jgi:hypothetical protein